MSSIRGKRNKQPRSLESIVAVLLSVANGCMTEVKSAEIQHMYGPEKSVRGYQDVFVNFVNRHDLPWRHVGCCCIMYESEDGDVAQLLSLIHI